ncbi:MAG: PAS domain S-box protein, partial [Elusimicrobia bacterium]|nr:PAS domain S-box protein [Elusimicrobiota bacterium]
MSGNRRPSRSSSARLARAESRLRESEDRFAKLFESSPAKTAIGTMDGRLVDVNRAYADFFGFRREEMVGRSIAELGLIAEDELRRLLAFGSGPGVAMREVEVAMRARDGRALEVLMSADIIRLDGVDHRVATLVDVTERRRAERERKALDARLAAV